MNGEIWVALIFGISALALYVIFMIIRRDFLEGYYSKDRKKQQKALPKAPITSPTYRFNENPTKVLSKTTLEAQALYYALKDRGILVELERYDGYKTIDISIPSARLNIEVDGAHHNLSSEQALADLKRTYYSYLEGYYTLRIPNSLLRSHLEETTGYIVGICKTSIKNNNI